MEGPKTSWNLSFSPFGSGISCREEEFGSANRGVAAGVIRRSGYGEELSNLSP
jgi:hypothetical protein